MQLAEAGRMGSMLNVAGAVRMSAYQHAAVEFDRTPSALWDLAFSLDRRFHEICALRRFQRPARPAIRQRGIRHFRIARSRLPVQSRLGRNEVPLRAAAECTARRWVNRASFARSVFPLWIRAIFNLPGHSRSISFTYIPPDVQQLFRNRTFGSKAVFDVRFKKRLILTVHFLKMTILEAPFTHETSEISEVSEQ
jgi:hypothetical protein